MRVTWYQICLGIQTYKKGAAIQNSCHAIKCQVIQAQQAIEIPKFARKTLQEMYNFNW